MLPGPAIHQLTINSNQAERRQVLNLDGSEKYIHPEFIMEMSLLNNETKDYKKIYAIHFSTGYWLLAGPSMSSKYLHLRGSEIHQQQKRHDPGSTFFRALRPTSSLKSNPSCAPSSSTSGVHKTSQAFFCFGF